MKFSTAKNCLSKAPLAGTALLLMMNVPTFGFEEGDPPNPSNIPDFFKSQWKHVEEELAAVQTGDVEAIAISPGGTAIHAVYYGEKNDLNSQANYNSAVAAGNPAYYARKGEDTKPTLFFLGPVHGQEVENIVGLVNFIHILETGEDYRGRDWSSLKSKAEQCRIIIIPCANPDGRKRCPYDSFVGVPEQFMTKYGQGTRTDGSLWRWPHAKALHPMEGNVGILGSYFNDDGVNMMHDEFFDPMAAETKAILDIAREEAPDLIVSLHSHQPPPVVLQASHVPYFMKERIYDLSRRVNDRYKEHGLAHVTEDRLRKPKVDDEEFPPRASFNLVSALHHVSGGMAFLYEAAHGTTSPTSPEPMVTHEDILDLQLHLYDVMLDYALEERLTWELEEKHMRNVSAAPEK